MNSSSSTLSNIYQRGLRVAIEGCGHGTLNEVYASVQRTEKAHKFKVDLLIICGDFQAVRNSQDLNCMSVPEKYRQLGDFHLYYSGRKKAPILTLFIGGNHEASNHNWELYYGGWVCPNIYFLGAANVVRIGGLRIAGISGIYSEPDYTKPHLERLPYNHKDVKTIYHVRQYDAYKLFQLREPVDIGLSHDWPQGIEHNGDIDWLLSEKPWFRKDIEMNALGSPPARILLYKWRPRYWFSAHLHIKYAAIVEHTASQQKQIQESKSSSKPERNIQEVALEKNNDEIDLESDLEKDSLKPAVPVKNNDEIQLEIDSDMESHEPTNKKQKFTNPEELPLDMEDDSVSSENEPKSNYPQNGSITQPTSTTRKTEQSPTRKQSESATSRSPSPKSVPTLNTVTKFLSLDKCLPRRDFLQIIEIRVAKSERFEPNDPKRLTLQYDPEWLAITRALNSFLATSHDQVRQLEKDDVKLREMIDNERKWVEENIVKPGKLDIPRNWKKTAPAQGETKLNPKQQPVEYKNPQTSTFCQFLGIENKIWPTNE